MSKKLILTISASDQTGLLNQVADAVSQAGGNWLESSMSHLAGKFAGIALVEIDPAKQSQLTDSLNALRESGLQILVEQDYDTPADTEQRLLEVEVVAHDRKGIVRELTALLSKLKVNIESLHTNRTVAAMSSEHLFEASAVVGLPVSLDDEDFRKHLETLSDDLMVELFDLDEERSE
ncbi:ACT domain-containing protein [Porticoccus sp. W117]|uniref:glycine cleavage system protein R n=1 Tax=Porticoccus sp. W117 TaxID=3054777 RepID=UPI00259132EB|nr:ACT domain-containing protein [Porticoccus sp. W117]MDM3872633.1 ACT domain-containing protein [Porticoccus sp. W117]